MFIVKHKERVVAGPMEWNSGFFNAILTELSVNATLPILPPADDLLPYVIDNDTAAYKVTLTYPDFNPKIEYLHGPFWTYEGGTALGTFEIKSIEIPLVKGTLKERVANVRYNNEIKGIKVTVQNTQVSVSTTRADRLIYSEKYNLLPENSVITWKFPEVWLQLSKSDLGAIVSAINTYVQNLYDEEYNKVQEIESATTLQQLDAIDLGE